VRRCHTGASYVEIDGTTLSKIVPVKPLGVIWARCCLTTVVDQVCDGKLEAGAARSALAWQAACRRFRRCDSRYWRPLAGVARRHFRRGRRSELLLIAGERSDRALYAMAGRTQRQSSSSRSVLRPSPVP